MLPEAPRREGRPPAPRRARREAHGADARAGRLHRRPGRGPVQAGPLPLLIAAQSACAAISPSGRSRSQVPDYRGAGSRPPPAGTGSTGPTARCRSCARSASASRAERPLDGLDRRGVPARHGGDREPRPHARRRAARRSRSAPPTRCPRRTTSPPPWRPTASPSTPARGEDARRLRGERRGRRSHAPARHPRRRRRPRRPPARRRPRLPRAPASAATEETTTGLLRVRAMRRRLAVPGASPSTRRAPSACSTTTTAPASRRSTASCAPRTSCSPARPSSSSATGRRGQGVAQPRPRRRRAGDRLRGRPVRALEARMEGFEVMPALAAADAATSSSRSPARARARRRALRGDEGRRGPRQRRPLRRRDRPRGLRGPRRASVREVLPLVEEYVLADRRPEPARLGPRRQPRRRPRATRRRSWTCPSRCRRSSSSDLVAARRAARARRAPGRAATSTPRSRGSSSSSLGVRIDDAHRRPARLPGLLGAER